MDDKEITTTMKPSGIEYKEVYDADYLDSGNRVVDMPGTIDGTANYTLPAVFASAITNSDATNGRSSIKYSNSEINLFFPMKLSHK